MKCTGNSITVVNVTKIVVIADREQFLLFLHTSWFSDATLNIDSK